MKRSFRNLHHSRTTLGLSDLGLPWPLRVGINTFNPNEGFEFLAYWDSHSFVTRGRLSATVGGRTRIVSANGIFFIPKDAICRLGSVDGKAAVVRSIDWIGAPVPLAMQAVERVARPEAAIRWHDTLVRWYSRNESVPPFRVGAAAFEWMAAVEPFPEPRRKSALASEALTGRAMQIMDSHLGQGLTLTELARMCGCGPSTLNRAFQRARKISPLEAMAELQLRRAKDLLLRTNHKLAHIARECGFAQEKYFSRWFSDRAGQPPGAWRRRHASSPSD